MECVTNVVVIMLLIKTQVMDYTAIRTKIMYYSYGNEVSVSLSGMRNYHFFLHYLYTRLSSSSLLLLEQRVDRCTLRPSTGAYRYG